MFRTLSPPSCFALAAAAVLVLNGCSDAAATGGDSATPPPRGTDASATDGALADGAASDAGPPPLPDGGRDAAPPPPPGSLPLAPALALDGVAVFQGVKVAVAESGAAADRNAPIVAGRDAVVRIYVQPEAGWTPREVTAHLIVTTGGVGTSHVLSQTVAGPSTDTTLGSAFDFDIPGSDIGEDTRIRVALTTAAGAGAAEGIAHPARYPRDGGQTDLGAQSDLGGLNLVLVPLRYDTDGSGRLPATGPADVALYREYLSAIFPYATVNITVHEAVPWTDSLGWDREIEFGDVNSMLVDLRAADGAPADAYYFALVQPNDSRSDYCRRAVGACTTGQSFVVSDADNDRLRLGSALGYGGESTAHTLAHELGHIHGRSHAPCSVSGSDRSYPYGGGAIGVWGYDPRDGSFLDPATWTDVMGYCSDRWISDYTYGAMFQRNLDIKALTTLAGRASTSAPSRFLHLEGGVARSGRAVTLNVPPRGERVSITWVSDAGGVIATGTGIRLEQSHADGDTLLVSDRPGTRNQAIVVDGLRYEPAPRR